MGVESKALWKYQVKDNKKSLLFLRTMVSNYLNCFQILGDMNRIMIFMIAPNGLQIESTVLSLITLSMCIIIMRIYQNWTFLNLNHTFIFWIDKFIKRFSAIMLMKSIVCSFTIFALLGYALHLEAYVPKLPIYIGEGYNIYEGNPMTNMIDPGFTMPIFDFSFDKGEKTEDGKFRVPDYTLSRQLSSCSYDAKVKSYKGARQYQEELKEIAGIKRGLNALIGKVAFSLSKNFQEMEKKTHNQQSLVTQAYSECQAYKVFIDSTKHLKLREDFIQKVKDALESDDWEYFILHLGTHYVTQVTMGGRAVQQLSFSYDSVSKLQAQGITANTAAQAEFFGFFMGDSKLTSDKSKAFSLAETMRKEKYEFYIGGKPPSKGNVRDWMTWVHETPMPIKYQLKEISDLFKFIKDINSSDATAQFQEALKIFCQKDKNCREPLPDYVLTVPSPANQLFPHPTPLTSSVPSFVRSSLPPPLPPLQYITGWTIPIGATKGRPFSFVVSHPQFMTLKKVVISSGNYIYSINLTFAGYSPQGKYFEESSQKLGQEVFQRKTWQVPLGQFVQKIISYSSLKVNGLQFVTNEGYASPLFGSQRGDMQIAQIFDRGTNIIGFAGQFNYCVTQLMFKMCKGVDIDAV